MAWINLQIAVFNREVKFEIYFRDGEKNFQVV